MAWEVKKLGDVVKKEKFSIVDGPFGTQLNKKEYVDEGIPVIRIKNITQEGKFSSKGLVYITEEKFQTICRSAVYPGDILLAKTGGTIGKLCLVPEIIKKGLISSSCAKISINKDIAEPRFIMFYLSTIEGQKKIIGSSGGSTRNSINLTPLKNIEVPCPDILKQRKILKIIDSAFEKIAKAKENSEQNLKNAKEVFESYLQKVFENKGEDWEENILGKILVKTETINPTKIPNKNFEYIDVSSVNNKTFLIESTSIINSTNAPSRARKLVKKGDVIFATVRPTLKRIAIVPNNLNEQICSTGYFVLRSKENIVNELIFYYLQTYRFMSNMEKLQKGASYPAVTDRQVKEQILAFPNSLEEQKQIVSKLDNLSNQTKQLESIYSQKLSSLEELKQSILQKAFKGELTRVEA